MAKSIVVVCGLEAVELSYCNPPKHIQALNSSLRATAVEADRAAL